MTRCPIVAMGLTLLAVSLLGQPRPAADFEKLPFAPRHAICCRTTTPLVGDGTLDEKRLMAVANFDNDVPEHWEWSGQGLYPVDASSEAYKLGVNYIIYGLTH